MRLRRKAAPEADEPGDEANDLSASATPAGPYDSGEVDLEGQDFVDLGSLQVRPPDGTELRLQVDEESGAVMAVVLVDDEGAAELRAFASSRDGDLWTDARREIAAETTRLGGTATEADGPFGPELRCMMTVQTPEGTTALQPSRVIGVNGPRWLLRASLMGQPAAEPESAAGWEDAIRAIVVHRGTEAMAPGEPLPLHLPPEARRVD